MSDGKRPGDVLKPEPTPEGHTGAPDAIEEALMSALADAMPIALRAVPKDALAKLARSLTDQEDGTSPPLDERERSLIERTLGWLDGELAAPPAEQTAPPEEVAITNEGAPAGGATKETAPARDPLLTWIETALQDERVTALLSEDERTSGAVPRRAWVVLCDQLSESPLPGDVKSRGLWVVALVAWKLRSLEGAALAAERKRAFDRGRGDTAGLALAVELAADVLERQGKVEEAFALRRQDLLPALAALGQHRRRAVLLGRIGDRLQAQEKWEEALAIRHEEIPVYEEHGDFMQRAVARTKIADALMARGENGEALRIYRETLRVLETAENPGNAAITLGKIARLLALSGKHDEALRIHREQVVPIYERLGDDDSRAHAHDLLADTFQAQGRVGEALRLRREGELPLREKQGDPKEHATALGKTADLLLMTRQFEEALAMYRKAEALFERAGDEKGRRTTQSRLSDVLEQLGDRAEAMRLRKEELAAYERAGDEPARAVTLAKIGAGLHAQGRSEEALSILRKDALPALERLGMVPERALALATAGDILLSRGKAGEAFQSYREALPLVQRTGDLRTEAFVLCKMADAKHALKQDDEALRLLKKEAAPLLQRVGALRDAVQAMRQAAQIHEARRQLDAAVRILKEDVVAVLERAGDEQGLIFERARLALVCLKRNAAGDRQVARDLLLQARRAAEARGMPYAQEIRKMQRLFKLEPS